MGNGEMKESKVTQVQGGESTLYLLKFKERWEQYGSVWEAQPFLKGDAAWKDQKPAQDVRTQNVWNERMLRKEGMRYAILSVESADMTVLCAPGNHPGWQRGGRGAEGPSGGAAQKTLWSNYMDGWCTEAGVNDTVVRKAGAGPGSWIKRHSYGQYTVRLIRHIFGLTSHFTCKWDVLLWMDGEISCSTDGNWGWEEDESNPVAAVAYMSSSGNIEEGWGEDWIVYTWIGRSWGLN